MTVAAIMPCRGRPEQTVCNVRRLLATAGDVDWQLLLVANGDDELRSALQHIHDDRVEINVFDMRRRRFTYWECLNIATTTYHHVPLIANLANDVLPGQHWLARAVSAYRATFGDGPGMVGFNDGHHETGHSCHFLISRTLLDRYGGWPVWYDHNFGDTELCQRAIADGLYVKAPWATLFHDHPYFGGADDQVYAEGRARVERDGILYEQRRAAGWPSLGGN